MEAAGLALAIFPLVIKGIFALVDASSTVKSMHRYSRELQRYAWDIETECAVFNSSLHLLLENMGWDPDEAVQLLEQPREALSEDPEFNHQLREYLNDSYTAFLRNMDGILRDLELICDKLSINQDRLEIKPMSFFQKELSRLKVTFAKAIYDEIFGRIRRANNFLRRITSIKQSLQSGRLKNSSKSQVTELTRLREHARKLRQCLAQPECWQCACLRSQALNLQLNGLERCLQSKATIIEFQVAMYQDQASCSPTQTPGWSCLKAQIDSKLQEQTVAGLPGKPRVRFAAAPSSANAARSGEVTTEKLIADLCVALSSASINTVRNDAYLGHLVLNDLQAYRYGLFQVPPPWADRQPAEPVKDILQRARSIRDGFILSYRSRMVLAARLALSVLVLDGSWLQTSWSLRDLLLIRGALCEPDDRGTVKKQDILLMSSKMGQPMWKAATSAVEIEGLQNTGIRSVTLFELGIALIELSLDAALEDKREPLDADPSEMVSRRKTANRLLPKVEENSGDIYMQVVERCLDCPFTVDRRDVSFDNVKFQALVYEYIVKPLRDIMAVMNS